MTSIRTGLVCLSEKSFGWCCRPCVHATTAPVWPQDACTSEYAHGETVDTMQHDWPHKALASQTDCFVKGALHEAYQSLCTMLIEKILA